MKVQATCYQKRILARITDLLMIWLYAMLMDLLFPDFGLSSFDLYLLYVFLVAGIDGRSFGKYLFGLSVHGANGKRVELRVRLQREVLFLLLSPILWINAVNLVPVPLHDAICKTRVAADEERQS